MWSWFKTTDSIEVGDTLLELHTKQKIFFKLKLYTITVSNSNNLSS